ncbi:hypothetical protein ACIG0D_01795 [Streptomyces sp. NPDC052773]|uniref:hypothetical protein n=1 Tax=Streptomyces sp. NPDC052773 TaxID=3365693 RepID=UPI0037D8414B
MIAEAIDTLITLGWAALAWLTVLAAVTAIVLLAGTAVGAWAVRLAWRTARPAWARGRRGAERIARRTRPDYEEAA